MSTTLFRLLPRCWNSQGIVRRSFEARLALVISQGNIYCGKVTATSRKLHSVSDGVGCHFSAMALNFVFCWSSYNNVSGPAIHSRIYNDHLFPPRSISAPDFVVHTMIVEGGAMRLGGSPVIYIRLHPAVPFPSFSHFTFFRVKGLTNKPGRAHGCLGSRPGRVHERASTPC